MWSVVPYAYWPDLKKEGLTKIGIDVVKLGPINKCHLPSN